LGNISVVIPWRPQPSRIFAYEKLLDWYKINYPAIDIIVSDSDTHFFELSRARNLGAQKAIDNGADIIIFNDADAFVSIVSMGHAIAHAEDFNEIVLPYSVACQHRSARETNLFFRKVFMRGIDAELGRIMRKPKLLDNGMPNKLYPCSLVTIVPSNIFKAIGGFNEDIKSWGPEDTLFHRQYFDLYGKTFTYIDGYVHTTYNDPSRRKVNSDYLDYYRLTRFEDRKD